MSNQRAAYQGRARLISIPDLVAVLGAVSFRLGNGMWYREVDDDVRLPTFRIQRSVSSIYLDILALPV